MGGQVDELTVGAEGEPVCSGRNQEVVGELEHLLFGKVSGAQGVSSHPEVSGVGVNEDEGEVGRLALVPVPRPRQEQIVGHAAAGAVTHERWVIWARCVI